MKNADKKRFDAAVYDIICQRGPIPVNEITPLLWKDFDGISDWDTEKAIVRLMRFSGVVCAGYGKSLYLEYRVKA
jgi:hypothetical protein